MIFRSSFKIGLVLLMLTLGTLIAVKKASAGDLTLRSYVGYNWNYCGTQSGNACWFEGYINTCELPCRDFAFQMCSGKGTRTSGTIYAVKCISSNCALSGVSGTDWSTICNAPYGNNCQAGIIAQQSVSYDRIAYPIFSVSSASWNNIPGNRNEYKILYRDQGNGRNLLCAGAKANPSYGSQSGAITWNHTKFIWDGVSNISNTVWIPWLAAIPTCSPPPAPSLFPANATCTTDTSPDLSATSSLVASCSNYEHRFEISQNGNPINTSSYIAANGFGTSSYSPSLSAGAFTWRAQAKNSAGEGSWASSNQINIIAEPSNLSVSGITNTSATVSWTPGSGNGYSQQVSIRVRGAITWGAWVTPTGNSHTFSGLSSGTAYEWAVRARFTGCTERIVIGQFSTTSVNAGISINQTPDTRSVNVNATFDQTITVTNSGGTRLTTVPLELRYDRTFLTYVQTVSGTQPVNNTNDGRINWNNLGAINVGQSITLVIRLTAIAQTAGTNIQSVINNARDQNNQRLNTTDTSVITVNTVGGSIGISINQTPDTRTVNINDLFEQTITVTNSGASQLTTVPLQLNYATAYLSYIQTAAGPGPVNNVNDGSINWVNLGALNPGQSTTVLVQMSAIAPVASTNIQSAITNAQDQFGATVSTSDTSTATINTPGIAITINQTPDTRTVNINDLFEQTITVTNTGASQLTTIPLQLNYVTTYLSYVQTTAGPSPVNNVNDGSINWTNLGALNPGQFTTVRVQMQAVAEVASANIESVITNAQDQFGISVSASDTSTVTFLYDYGWLQVYDGNIFANGSISVDSPTTEFPLDRLYPLGGGVVIAAGAGSTISPSLFSVRGWKMFNYQSTLLQNVDIDFDSLIPTATVLPSPNPFVAPFAQDGTIYYVNGNVVISAPTTLNTARFPNNTAATILVNGDIHIGANLTFASSSNTKALALVALAGHGIYIYSPVTNIEALLFTQGVIHTGVPATYPVIGCNSSSDAQCQGQQEGTACAAPSNSYCTQVGASNRCTCQTIAPNSLSVRGGLIGLTNIDFGVRQSADMLNIADETITYNPYYLINFPPGLSTYKLIWKETP